MKRTRRRILSAALAAAMLLCTVPKDAPLRLLKPPLSASAEGKITYDKETETLTLSGVLTEETLKELRDSFVESNPDIAFQTKPLQKIVAAPGCVFPKNCAGMFWSFDATKEIDLSNADTSKVTDMGGMFDGCSSLERLDLSSFDTSNVTIMLTMFRRCSSLKTLDLSSFDTSKVTSMVQMFRSCSSLETLGLSSFDTSNVTAMTDMFNECKSLQTLDLSSFDTSNVAHMTTMFGDCFALQTIYVSNLWNTETAKNTVLENGWGTSYLNLFSGCEKLKGGSGTAYTAEHINTDYARIDNPPEEKGYLTRKPVTTSGKCGENLTWNFDAETGMLTIEGTGAMYEWDWIQNHKNDVIYDYPDDEEHRSVVCEYTEYSYATNAPWEAYKDSIQSIVLPEGITSVSPYSFCHCSVLKTLVLPASLASLGGYAFYACPKLKDVVVQNPETAFAPDAEKEWNKGWTICNDPNRDVTYDRYGDSYTMKFEYPSYPNNIYGYADSTAQTFAEKYDTWSGKLLTFKRLLHVTFDANGGTGELDGIMLGYPEDQKTFTLPECSFTAPETGMVFAGWNVLGETKQPGDEITSEDGITVKALWEYSFYEIKFDANGGTGEQETLKVLVNTTFYLPACTFTAPEGLSFTGWQISGATDKTWQPGDPFLAEQNVTLVPVWAKTACTVTFDANGGTGEMDAKTVAVNAEFTFPKCKFTAPEGKQFSAWMIGEDTYEIGDTVTIAEDTVIKAVWTAAQEDPFVPASDKKRGNLDGSGAIDTKDAMLLSRYVNGWDDTVPDPEAADIDGDGDVAVRDAMILTRYVNGWEGYGRYFDTES